MKKNVLLGFLLSSMMGAGIALGVFTMVNPQNDQVKTIKVESGANEDIYSQVKLTGEVPAGLNFIGAAKSATPAVVHIKNYKEYAAMGNSNDPYNEWLRQFFYQQPQPKQDGPVHSSSGSGVIIAEDGYIVTNNHVVKDADIIEVILNDKKTYTAELLGTDPTTDLALLKIEEKGLPHLQFANSDDVNIGEWVLAVGNPFDLSSTVTAGIVSAKARNINILRSTNNLAIESFIQTDAAVNPGNSGGALVNLRGELIGINTAIASPTGAYAGYSFAVPATLVKKVISDLKEYGEVQRGLLGVSIMDINSKLAEEKKLEDLNGVYIAEVRDNSAAYLAGLKEDDVIIKINEKSISNTSELQEVIGRYRPGDEVTVTYVRASEVKSTQAILHNKMGTTEIVTKEDVAVVTVLGADITQADKEVLNKLRLRNGVAVKEVKSGKLRDAGIKEGFIIVKVNRVPVDDPEDVYRIISNSDEAIYIEGFYPNGRKMYIGFEK